MRAWSNLRIASRIILIIIPAVGLVYIYVPIEFETKIGRNKCPAWQGTNPIFVGIWSLIIFSLGPSTVMLTFGWLTVRHVQQTLRRIVPQNTQTQIQPVPSQRQKITDRQLIQMTIMQSVFFSLMSTPVSVNWIYITVRPSEAPTALQNAKDDLFSSIVSALSLTGACTSFYLFTLSSKLFRRELMQLFIRPW